jgi:4,5-DOPA dioxygenase extradiol
MRAPVLLVSHGAAALTAQRSDPTFIALTEARALLAHASALVVISAHDVRDVVTIGSAPKIEMLHDHMAAEGKSWTGRSDPNVAQMVKACLDQAGIAAALGQPRLDHGAWLPLIALDPAGAHPIVTVSLQQGLHPEAHLRLGRALAPLRVSGVVILTSGGLTHNQERFRSGFFAAIAAHGREAAFAGRGMGEQVHPPSSRFEAWALETLALPSEARERALLDARTHPDFSWAHPTMDHWLPTLIAAGAATGLADDAGDAPRVVHRGFQHSLSTALVAFGA